MHLDHDHIAGGAHEHTHEHTHAHTHEDGTTHTHPHEHAHTHAHTHDHEHEHAHIHEDGVAHTHSHGCDHDCQGCGTPCEHTPMEELTALMKYMVGHNAAHAKELADEAGNHDAYEQVMAAVSDFEKGNMRLSVILASLAK